MAYIMIVDDDHDFASAVAQVLRFGGHEVQIELNTHTPLESIPQRKPDLMILDVMFPEDPNAGFTLARTISADPSLRGMPILMVSGANTHLPLGFGGKDDDGTHSAIAATLDKPIDLDALTKTVESLLHR